MNLTRLSMVAAAGLLAACSTAPTVEPPAASQPPASSPAAAPTQDAPTAAGEPTQGEGTQPFGSTATWPDGVSITVSKPMPFKPSEYAAVGTKAPKYVAVEVTLKNGSKAPVESSMASLRATSGDQEAESVFDSAKGIEMSSSRVLPGKSLKWRQVFGQPGSDIAVTADWNWQGPVTFQ